MQENGNFVRYHADDDDAILKSLVRHVPYGWAYSTASAVLSPEDVPLITGLLHDGYYALTYWEAKQFRDHLNKALSDAQHLLLNEDLGEG